MTLGAECAPEGGQDHAAVWLGLGVLILELLWVRYPNAEWRRQRRLRRILGEKNAAQDGVRAKRTADALRILADIHAFAKWSESEFDRRG